MTLIVSLTHRPSRSFASLMVIAPVSLVYLLTGCQSLLTSERPLCTSDNPTACTYSHRTTLTIDNSQRDEELTDFPLLVTFSPDDIDYTEFAADGRDMLFLDSQTLTPLPYEIENWNPGRDSRVWVKVPRIPAQRADTRIELLHDSARVNLANVPSEVWTNGYESVHHFAETDLGSGDLVADSTNHQHDGTLSGDIASVEGPLGGGVDFSGLATSHINLGTFDEMLPAPGESTSISFWLQLREVIPNFDGYIVLEKEFSCSGLRLQMQGDGALVAVLLSPGPAPEDPCTGLGAVGAGAAAMNDDWEYMVITLDRTIDTATVVYLETRGDTDPYRSTQSMPIDLTRGIENSASARLGTNNESIDPNQPRLPLVGAFDEFRVSTRERSKGWHDAQYAAMTVGMVSFQKVY